MSLPKARQLQQHYLESGMDRATPDQREGAKALLEQISAFLLAPHPDLLGPNLALTNDILSPPNAPAPVGLHMYSADPFVLSLIQHEAVAAGYFVELSAPAMHDVAIQTGQCNDRTGQYCLHIGNLRGLEQVGWVAQWLYQTENPNPDLPPIVMYGGAKPHDPRRRWQS